METEIPLHGGVGVGYTCYIVNPYKPKSSGKLCTKVFPKKLLKELFKVNCQ